MHPFHPLSGHEFELLYRRLNWGVDRVYYHDSSGRLRSLPAAWTSVVAPDPVIIIAAGRAYFRVEDLLAMVALVAELREVKGADGTAEGGKEA